MAPQRTSRRALTRLAGGVFFLCLIGAFIWFVHTMMTAAPGKSQRQVQIVQVIRPPPPPPDQPPPPPPEKTETPLPKDEPTPVPDNTPAPADQPLGLDAEGSAGGDAFGLAARRGGSDLIGGSGNSPFAWYTTRLRDAIAERLSGIECAKAARGSLTIHVLLESDGQIKQVQLATTTGNRQVDQCIDSALAALPRLSDPPPPGMPEQVNLRIVARS